MPKVVQDSKDYKSPPHKIISFLKTSRDKLRVKYTELKNQLRTAENQVRAVEKSRHQWRERAQQAEQELAQFKKKTRPGLRQHFCRPLSDRLLRISR